MIGPASKAARLTLAVGLLFACVGFLATAPFRCDLTGHCQGILAFDYPYGKTGYGQSSVAAIVVGVLAALFTWVASTPMTRWKLRFRMVVSVGLAGAIPISLISQSFMMIVGPVVGGALLWLLWLRSPSRPLL
jgi:hypothetical protein